MTRNTSTAWFHNNSGAGFLCNLRSFQLCAFWRKPVHRLRRELYLLLVFLVLLPLRSVKAQEPLPDLNSWRQQKSYALLFATNDYDYWKHLSGPIPDAKALKNILEQKYGFQTELVEDPTRDQILIKLRQYEQRQFGDADQLLIFFAGHGFRDSDSNQGYLVAKDTKLASEDLGRASFESYDDLRGKIDAIPVKHLLLVLDACFGGTFDAQLLQSSSRGDDSSAASLAERFRDRMPYTSRKYLASGGDRYVPDTSASGHSPFVTAFLQALYDHDRGYFATPDLEAALESINPEPRGGNWGSNQAGSEFFFISKACVETGCGAGSKAIPEASVAAYPPALIKVAVMGFKDLSNHAGGAWLSDVLASQITADIAGKGGMKVTSAGSIAKIKAQLSLEDSPGYEKDALTKLNTLLGANYIVTGSYLVEKHAGKDQVQLNVVLQNAATGETVAEFPEVGSLSNLTDLSTHSSGSLRSKLPIAVVDSLEPETKAADSVTASPDAIRAYREGLEKLESYDLPGARDALEKAVAIAPDSPMIEEALSKTWSELGFDQKAKTAAERAFDLSKQSASLETRLLLEANYRELNSQWDQASEIYRELWQGFPNDVNYGLELARVQTDGGKGKDALATLAKLRTDDPSSAQDPRIDLQEALTAEALGDAKLQQQASEAAAEKAAKFGSRLFLAEAYWQQCSALTSLGQLKLAEAACERANTDADFAAARKIKARTLTTLANVMAKEGAQSNVMEIQQQILRMARSVGSEKDIIGALLNLANSQSIEGLFSQAEANREEAMNRAVTIGDKNQLLSLQNDQAADLQEQARYQDALAMLTNALETARAVGDRKGTAIVLVNLGSLRFELGQLTESEKNIRESLAIAQAADLESLSASALLSLGDVQMARAELAGAQASYQEAYQRFEKIGEQDNIASSELALAKWSLEDGKPDAAIAFAQQAADKFEKDKSGDLQADSEITIARALLKQEKLPQADAALAAAVNLAPQDRVIQLSLAIAKAETLGRIGKIREASTELVALIEQAKGSRLVAQELEARLALAQVTALSDPKTAMAQLEAARDEAERIGYILIAHEAMDTREQLAGRK
jgi:tetratricopeptide (TPR) repeat protein